MLLAYFTHNNLHLQIRIKGGGQGPQTMGLSGGISAEKGRNLPDRKKAAVWVSVCCFPRPSPARPTVGGRTPPTKRAHSVCCLWPLTCGLTSWLTRQVHVCFCLTVINFYKRRSKRTAVGILASCCLSTEPVSTSQEPAETPQPSHRGELSYTRRNNTRPVKPFIIKVLPTETAQTVIN